MASKRKAKFKVGQVVRVVGSKELRSFLPDYFRIYRVLRDTQERFVYAVSDHDSTGPCVAEKQLRPLTAREKGGRG